MEDHGILNVAVTEYADVEASAAIFDLTIQGERILFGKAIVEQSQTVKGLIEALRGLGVEDADISFVSVRAKSHSGLFGKDSKAYFRLHITLEDMSKLNECLSVVSQHPGTVSNEIQWLYDIDQVIIDLECRAMAKAKQKAELMAAAISHVVVGVMDCDDGVKTFDTHYGPEDFRASRIACATISRSEELDFGIEIKSVKRISQTIKASFYIAPETASS